MIDRFTRSGLIEKVHFIPAVPPDSALVDYYGSNVLPSDQKKRDGIARLLSHLQALRVFLASVQMEKSSGAIVCEDNILLSNNFADELQPIFENLPGRNLPSLLYGGTPLIALSYIVRDWSGFVWRGLDPEQHNLCVLVPENTFGTPMYWISPEYAIEVLDRYDRPVDQISGLRPDEAITSELIVRRSRGYIAYPLLAIRDGIDSQEEDDFFVHWGPDNFSDCQSDDDKRLSRWYKANNESEGKSIDVSVDTD